MNTSKQLSYDSNIFINCPFDAEYKLLLEAMVFTIHVSGFTPRCALEYSDSDDIRILKIIKLISECKYGIHDLSKKEARFNMPLELGIFIGAKQYGKQINNAKKYLILASEQFEYQKFISDLSGQDIKSHNNDIKALIKCVRDWLSDKSKINVPHPSYILENYTEFRKNLPQICEEIKWKVEELTFSEYNSLVFGWISDFRTKR